MTVHNDSTALRNYQGLDSFPGIFNEAWELLKNNLALYCLYAGFIIVTHIALNFIPLVGSFISFFIYPIQFAGFFHFSLKALRLKGPRLEHPQPGELEIVLPYMEWRDFFVPSETFLPLIILSIFTSVLSIVGTFFFIIPGLYLWIAYQFVPLVYLDEKPGLWDSLEISRKIIHKNWWSISWILGLGSLIWLAGILFLGVGVIATTAFFHCLLSVLYQRCYEGLKIQSHLH